MEKSCPSSSKANRDNKSVFPDPLDILERTRAVAEEREKRDPSEDAWDDPLQVKSGVSRRFNPFNRDNEAQDKIDTEVPPCDPSSTSSAETKVCFVTQNNIQCCIFS